MSDDSDTQLIDKILTGVKSGSFKLPSPPEVALKVHEVMSDDSKGIPEIARVIRYDAALITRLIRVANSPIYRGQKAVTECKTAVARIGMKMTRNLVYSVAMSNAFASRSAKTKKLMTEVWQRGRKVAAISHVLAKKAPGLDPSQALVGGLVHNVGFLPILQYVDDYPDLAHDPARLTGLIERLRGPLGQFVLRAWRFDDELAALPTRVFDWMCDHEGAADYADLVIVARAHARFGAAQGEDEPNLVDLPAFKKLPMSRQGPEVSIEALREAQAEINELAASL